MTTNLAGVGQRQKSATNEGPDEMHEGREGGGAPDDYILRAPTVRCESHSGVNRHAGGEGAGEAR